MIYIEDKDMVPSKILSLWEEVRLILESTDLDLRKGLRGNIQAFKRTRTGVLLLNRKIKDLRKQMTVLYMLYRVKKAKVKSRKKMNPISFKNLKNRKIQ